VSQVESHLSTLSNYESLACPEVVVTITKNGSSGFAVGCLLNGQISVLDPLGPSACPPGSGALGMRPARPALQASCTAAPGGKTLQSPREDGPTVGFATLRVANPTLDTADRE
jgi:hypothetical protein